MGVISVIVVDLPVKNWYLACCVEGKKLPQKTKNILSAQRGSLDDPAHAAVSDGRKIECHITHYTWDFECGFGGGGVGAVSQSSKNKNKNSKVK